MTTHITINENISTTSHDGKVRVRYIPNTEARVVFSALWSDIVRGEEAPIKTSIHQFAETTMVEPAADIKSSIGIQTLPMVVTHAVLGEWIKFCDESIESAAYDCDCDEADLTVEEITVGMQRSWRVSPEDAEHADAVNAAA